MKYFMLTLLFLSYERIVVAGGVRYAHVDVSDFRHLTYGGKRVKRLIVGIRLKEPLERGLDCLRNNNSRHLLQTYHGSINQRNIKGTNRKSNHWWGNAIDFNMFITQPPLVVRCFEEAGLTWGGRWQHKPDYMHFEIGKRQRLLKTKKGKQ